MLILSDIHFGSELCNADLLLEVFAKFKFKRLILNGDIFDHLNLEFEERKRHLKDGELPRMKKHRLKRSHLKALTFISGLSNLKMIAKWFGSKATMMRAYPIFFPLSSAPRFTTNTPGTSLETSVSPFTAISSTNSIAPFCPGRVEHVGLSGASKFRTQGVSALPLPENQLQALRTGD
jgi:hypothetical protein